MSLRILLVDDHPLFRAGVAAVLRADASYEVCAETTTAVDALRAAEMHRPDVAVVDLMLGGDDGLKLIRDLRRELPEMRILVLTMLDEGTYRPRALQSGADAYVNKRGGPEQIVEAIRSLLARPVISRPATTVGMIDESAVLSERELQVFRELGLGYSTQEVATRLGVSGKTIETHRESIKLKLGLPHANALIVRAALWVRAQGLMH